MPENDGAPDLAGYASPEELAKAYRASSDEGKRQRQRADQLEQRLSAVEQSFTRQSVPQRANPADSLSEYGIPVDTLDAFVSERVARGVAKAFEPIARGATARNTIMSEYPDYQKFETDVARYVESDPEMSNTYQRLFEADPAGAMEFAFLKFGEAKRKEHPNGATKPQTSARAEAQIPSNRAGDARTIAGNAGEELLSRSWDHYQKTGDPRAFAKARIRQVVSDEFLSK